LISCGPGSRHFGRDLGDEEQMAFDQFTGEAEGQRYRCQRDTGRRSNMTSNDR
jgi:hypothetical protein